MPCHLRRKSSGFSTSTASGRREEGAETEIEYSAWLPNGEINFHHPDHFDITTLVRLRQRWTATLGLLTVAP
jgi:hypothetical protein